MEWQLATSAELAEVAQAARARGRLGIDTEFMSEGRYRPLLCLAQVAVDAGGNGEPPRIALIDGLDAELQVGPLAELVEFSRRFDETPSVVA